MNLKMCDDTACLCRSCAAECAGKECEFCATVSRSGSAPVTRCDKHVVAISVEGRDTGASTVD